MAKYALLLSVAVLLLQFLCCMAICIENGELPVPRYDLNCTGSGYEEYCCDTPADAVNSSVCLPHPWGLDSCQGGFYRGQDNATTPCPDGFYCPENALCMVRCSQGAYCKQAAPQNVSTCSVNRRNGRFCCSLQGAERRDSTSASGVSCGGASTNQPCAPGHYCPTTAEQLPCPESHYCREGSVTPQRCPPMSSCPAGSSSPKTNIFSLFISFLLALIMAGFVLCFKSWQTILHHLVYVTKKGEPPSAGENPGTCTQTDVDANNNSFSWFGLGPSKSRNSRKDSSVHLVGPFQSVVSELSVVHGEDGGARRKPTDAVFSLNSAGDHEEGRRPTSRVSELESNTRHLAQHTEDYDTIGESCSRRPHSKPALNYEQAGGFTTDYVTADEARERAHYRAVQLRMLQPNTLLRTRNLRMQRCKLPELQHRTAAESLYDYVTTHREPSKPHEGERQMELTQRWPGVSERTDQGTLAELKDTNMFVQEKKYTVRIDFKHLTLTHKTAKKIIIEDATGSVRPGNLTAVMGSSGTGKTSLLNCLCGKAYYADLSGDLCINGEAASGLDKYRSVLGFVPQDDIMHTDLTVHEVLTYQAQLRLPRSWTSEQRKEKVAFVEELLRIDNVRNSLVGTQSSSQKISGGQRKRVSIGMELVADPTILFLDEPTSGLDSVTSQEIVNLLKTMANDGKLTVFMVIHQPRYEIFQQFDDLILMENGGRIAFQGSPVQAEEYFKTLGCDERAVGVNPPDYYLDTIDMHHQRWELSNLERRAGVSDVVTIADRWEMSLWREQNSPLPYKATGPEFIPAVKPLAVVQFFFLLHRFMRLMLRTWYIFALDLALIVLAGGVLGALFKQISLPRLLVANIMSGLAIGLIGMISALRPFGDAAVRPIFWRESSAGINRVSYFFAVMVGNLSALIVFPVFFLAIYYSLTAPRASFGQFYVIFLFTFWAVFGLGYLLSTTVHPDNSKMAAVVVALIGTAVGGTSTTTICKLQSYTYIGPFLYSIFYTKWFAEGIFEVEANRHLPVLRYQVELIAGLNDFSLNNLPLCLGALFAIGCVARALALIFLLFTHRGEQK